MNDFLQTVAALGEPGNLLAGQSITMNTGANLDGRAMALNGAVTLDDNVITLPSVIPEPTALGLLIVCAAGFALHRRRFSIT